MYGTFWPLILPAIAAPTTVYFMKQYMESSLSLEIVEAGRIDGAGEFKIFNRIVLPLLKPAMATQAIFAFVASWNNLYTPSILLGSNRELSTLPMYAEAIRSNDKVPDLGQAYAAMLCAILPIIIAYLCLSKYIIAGVALGGVKE
jgi:multiple sugar transport system permease protein